MKIGPSGEKPVPGATNGTTVPTGAAASRATPAETGKPQGSVAAQVITGEASATVALSSTASRLMEGLNELTADFNADKVARVSQSLADGTYQIHPEVIADKLIANAKELLSNAQ